VVARKFKRKKKGDPGAMVAIDRKIAPHAHFLEFGTVKMSARPFFRPAVDATRSRAAKLITKGVERAIKTAGGHK